MSNDDWIGPGPVIPGGTTLGGWLDLLRDIAHGWSGGGEAGYVTLPEGRSILAVMPSEYTSHTMFSASTAVQWRSAGAVRAGLIGTFGYFRLTHRMQFRGLGVIPDEVHHEEHPGFSLGIGISGSGPLAPGVRLRWHKVPRPEPHPVDMTSLEASLHFR